MGHAKIERTFVGFWLVEIVLSDRTIGRPKNILKFIFGFVFSDSVQSKLDAQNDHEAASKEKIFTLNTTIASLEEKLQAALLRAEQSEAAMQQKQLEQELKSSEHRNEAKRHHDTETTLLTCQQKIKELEETAVKDREMFDTERKKLVQELKKARELQDNTLVDREGSPTLSLGGRSSFNDSLTSNHWQMDDLDCSLSNSGRMAGVSAHYQPPLTATSVLENLQSTLKQREGEILQQQWELSRLQSEKNYLTTEVGNLIAELDTIRETLAGHEAAMREFAELREQHDAILQLYGGLLEANEEIKLDLLESKQAYRTQIDELLQQKREGRL
jgi:TATA element modulatory factor